MVGAAMLKREILPLVPQQVPPLLRAKPSGRNDNVFGWQEFGRDEKRLLGRFSRNDKGFAETI